MCSQIQTPILNMSLQVNHSFRSYKSESKIETQIVKRNCHQKFLSVMSTMSIYHNSVISIFLQQSVSIARLSHIKYLKFQNKFLSQRQKNGSNQNDLKFQKSILMTTVASVSKRENSFRISFYQLSTNYIQSVTLINDCSHVSICAQLY